MHVNIYVSTIIALISYILIKPYQNNCRSSEGFPQHHIRFVPYYDNLTGIQISSQF